MLGEIVVREGVASGPVGLRDPPARVLGERHGDSVGVELEQADHRERLHARARRGVAVPRVAAGRRAEPIRARRRERCPLPHLSSARGRSGARARRSSRGRGACIVSGCILPTPVSSSTCPGKTAQPPRRSPGTVPLDASPASGLRSRSGGNLRKTRAGVDGVPCGTAAL